MRPNIYSEITDDVRVEAATAVQQLALLPHNKKVPPGVCKQHSDVALLGTPGEYLVRFVCKLLSVCIQDAFLAEIKVGSCLMFLFSCSVLSIESHQSDL